MTEQAQVKRMLLFWEYTENYFILKVLNTGMPTSSGKHMCMHHVFLAITHLFASMQSDSQEMAA